MNYYKYLIKEIGKIVSDSNCDYILYPFGERGALVKGILNIIYNIDEKVVIDNLLCSRCDKVKDLEYLKQIEEDNYKILITSDNIDIYEEIREKLYAVVNREKCIELLPVPELIVAKRMAPKVMEKMKSEMITQDNPIYQPKYTKSVFYLPLLLEDVIQRHIFLSDDYYESERLNQVFRLHEGGIIGQKISQGQGIILDVGANIGNHTLYFCNEFNAKKVYCFEPVKKTFSILEENIKLNHLEERVVLNLFGLGERDSKAFINPYSIYNIGGACLRQDEKGDVEVRKLDELGIDEPVVLIKIDVERMEKDVIRGGMKLIEKNHPYIMLESFEDKFPEMQDILCGMGYKYKGLGSVDWLFYMT